MNPITIYPTIADLFLLSLLEEFPDYPTIHSKVHHEREPIEVSHLDGSIAETPEGDGSKEEEKDC